MAKNESSSIAKLAKSMLAIIFIVAASVGGTMLYNGTIQFGAVNAAGTENTASEQSAVLPSPIFTPLEPFTVTLRGERSNRILYVAITLRVPDEASRRTLVNYMPEVRDRILRKLAEQNAEQVQTVEGRAALVQILTRDLEAAYSPEPRGPTISAVLFTAFVVQ